MRKRPASQLDLSDTFLASVPANEILERLEALVDWQPLKRGLDAMLTAQTGRLPKPPLVAFKMLLLSHCYGLSDSQCEELVHDRLSWQRFVGLNPADPILIAPPNLMR